MALSDIIRRIEDSPRSTKVAVGSVGVAVAASAIAVFAVMNQPSYRSEPASPVAKVVADATPASLAPSPTPLIAPTPVPTETPSPAATPEADAVEEPTPVPTETPLPTAVPTPEVNDFFVVIGRGSLDNDAGIIQYYNRYSDSEKIVLAGLTYHFYHEAFYLEYLRKEGVITSEQKNTYFDGKGVKIPLLSIADATYKLYKNDPSNANMVGLRHLLEYADKDSLD